MEDWDRGLRINVTSMVLMCRHAVPEMRKVGRGAIVNLSSVSGRESPDPPFTPVWTLVGSWTTVSMQREACMPSRARADADEPRSLTVMGGNPSLLYATTKGAVVQMTRAMASHYGLDQIRVNCVAPGMVYTPMVRGGGMSDEMRRLRIDQSLLRREGTAWDVGHGESGISSEGLHQQTTPFHQHPPERKEDIRKKERKKEKGGKEKEKNSDSAADIRTAILFLCSKEAKWITGLVMPVDGGVRTTPTTT